MKSIISLLICSLIVMTTMCVFASANENDVIKYTENDIEYTVEFEDSALSDEKKTVIVNALIGTDESGIMLANIWCDIFGHDYKYTTVSVIEHKASAIAPRCKKQTYDVTYCEDCDYTQETLVNVTYINCCPED